MSYFYTYFHPYVRLFIKIIIKIIISFKISNPSYLVKKKDEGKQMSEQIEILNTSVGP